MTKRITFTAIAAALCLMAPMAAFADPGDVRRGEKGSRKAPITFPASPLQSNFSGPGIVSFPVQVAAVAISPSRAKAIALARHKGAEYLDIRLHGGKVYIVRLMKSGQRFDVKVDANTGRIVG